MHVAFGSSKYDPSNILSSARPLPKPLQIAPSSRNQVFKHLRLWGHHIQPTTTGVLSQWIKVLDLSLISWTHMVEEEN